MKSFSRTVTAALAPITLFAGTTACAQTQTLPSPVPDTKVPASELEITDDTGSGPALWSVSDEDTTIYLFGTVHALPKELEWYDGVISKALTSSDTIVTEIDMGPNTEAAIQQLVVSKALLPAGTTLRSLLSEEQTTVYEASLAKLGAPAAAFDQVEPWFAGITLATLPLIQQGYSPDAGVENVLLEKAGDKKTEALETIEFQFGIFDGLPQASQIEFLMEAAEGVDEVKPFLDKMVAEWVAGDADGLAELMNEGLSDPELAEQLLYARNRNWADWIESRMETPGTLFIAVGAGHLAGEKSVQDYLEERGIISARIQ